MVEVVTVSNRPQGLEIVSECLKRQDTDYEWIVVSPTKPDYDCIWIPDPPKGKFWPLNACYNLALNKVKGDVFVSIQDYIWFPPDALSKFEYHAKSGMVSGVGDIYKDLVDGKPENPVWFDPRKRTEFGTYYECNYNDIEMNFCAYPTEKLKEVGGFNENLDKLGYDPVNVDIGARLASLGVKPFLDQTNECRGLKHEEHPKDWDKNFTMNGAWQEECKRLMEVGQWPVLTTSAKSKVG